MVIELIRLVSGGYMYAILHAVEGGWANNWQTGQSTCHDEAYLARMCSMRACDFACLRSGSDM